MDRSIVNHRESTRVNSLGSPAHPLRYIPAIIPRVSILEFGLQHSVERHPRTHTWCVEGVVSPNSNIHYSSYIRKK